MAIRYCRHGHPITGNNVRPNGPGRALRCRICANAYSRAAEVRRRLRRGTFPRFDADLEALRWIYTGGEGVPPAARAAADSFIARLFALAQELGGFIPPQK